MRVCALRRPIDHIGARAHALKYTFETCKALARIPYTRRAAARSRSCAYPGTTTYTRSKSTRACNPRKVSHAAITPPLQCNVRASRPSCTSTRKARTAQRGMSKSGDRIAVTGTDRQCRPASRRRRDRAVSEMCRVACFAPAAAPRRLQRPARAAGDARGRERTARTKLGEETHTCVTYAPISPSVATITVLNRSGTKFVSVCGFSGGMK